MKYLPKDLIPDYTFEIIERLAIAADGEETTSRQHLELSVMSRVNGLLIYLMK
jgi:hypothetical protein